MTSQPRVLVVEDDDVHREAVHRLLQEYICVDAETGGRAIQLLRSDRFDCVLLDYRLPDYSGLELLPIVERHTAVVMLTAAGSQQTAVDAMKMGCQDYLVKENLTREALTRAVGNAIDKVALQRRSKMQEEQLARSYLELQQFAYAASHDLQEPLRSIAGFADLLQQSLGSDLPGESRAHLLYMVEAAKRLRALLNDLRAYTELDSNPQPLRMTEMTHVVTDALSSLASSISETDANVSCDPLPVLAVDRAQLLQLFRNLIDNAIKYRSHRQPRISIGAHCRESEWEFAVADNGIGILPEHHEKIFGVFTRLHDRSEHGGNGIGLAVCRHVVHRHGGRIWVKSSPDCGSTFYFTLPVQSGGEL